MRYSRFFAMIGTSTVVMFVLMYLNTYLFSHVFWSETRAYMAFVMGAVMAVIMLAFMLSMYRNKLLNAAIFLGSIIVFAGALWLVRSQATIGDRAYMSAMIPHHSIAIMTSSRANISDPRVRKLADEIIYAQDKEIAEMRFLIADIARSGDAREIPQPKPARIVSLEEALATQEIAPLDPEFLSDDEITQLFPNNAVCRFTFTEDSKPSLVVGDADGQTAALVKISGDLVRLSSDDAVSAARAFSIPGLALDLTADDTVGRRTEAELTLKLDQRLSAGYSGYYGCNA